MTSNSGAEEGSPSAQKLIQQIHNILWDCDKKHDARPEHIYVSIEEFETLKAFKSPIINFESGVTEDRMFILGVEILQIREGVDFVTYDEARPISREQLDKLEPRPSIGFGNSCNWDEELKNLIAKGG